MKSYISGTRIYYPKPGQVYNVKDHTSNEIQVTFELVAEQEIEDIVYIDISDFSFLKVNYLAAEKLIYKGVGNFIYPNTLPLNVNKATIPSALFFPPGANCLLSLSTMKVLINPLSASFSFNQMHYSPLTIPLPVQNRAIANECVAMINPAIKVTRFQYPLFIDEKKPSKEFIADFLKKFLKYNKSQLPTQWKLSENYCTARAHALSILLNQYGITTYKVFQTWPRDSYKWGYHCAVMVIDANDEKWVLDPWVSLPLELLTINQWLSQQDVPLPYSFSIANSTVIGNTATYAELIGEEILYLPPFVNFMNARFLKALHTVYSLMTPTRLERPIAMKSLFKNNPFALFSPNEAHSESSSRKCELQMM